MSNMHSIAERCIFWSPSMNEGRPILSEAKMLANDSSF